MVQLTAHIVYLLAVVTATSLALPSGYAVLFNSFQVSSSFYYRYAEFQSRSNANGLAIRDIQTGSEHVAMKRELFSDDLVPMVTRSEEELFVRDLEDLELFERDFDEDELAERYVEEDGLSTRDIDYPVLEARMNIFNKAKKGLKKVGHGIEKAIPKVAHAADVASQVASTASQVVDTVKGGRAG